MKACGGSCQYYNLYIKIVCLLTIMTDEGDDDSIQVFESENM